MREIIFRGKTKDGKWVYGDLVTMQNICISNTWHEVIRVKDETVGQYTGLKDKNGKKIFEGDIIDFDEKEWGCKHIEEVKFDYEYLDLRKSDFGQWCEVIGNVFDNSELLKQFD